MKNGEYELVKAPENYPGKLYRGKYVYEHHLVWWKNTGEMPSEGEIIHHINGDKRDNSFANLKCMTSEEHKSYHGKFKSKRKVLLECPVCGGLFSLDPWKSCVKGANKNSFCSRKCIGKCKDYSKDYDQVIAKYKVLGTS